MSFSISVVGKRSDLAALAEDKFGEQYSDPAPGTRELLSVGLSAVEDFSDTSQDEGNYSLTISGHAKQSDQERDYLSIGISATT